MTAVDQATTPVDAALREDDEDSIEDRHLIAWVAVGLYESLDPDEPSWVGVTGNGNSATHVGLLELGKTMLL